MVLDAKSLVSNIRARKTGAALVDAGGLIVDVLATAVPFIPGGAGTAIKAMRGADKAVDAVNAVDNVSDVVKASNKTIDVAESINKSNKIVPHGETQFTNTEDKLTKIICLARVMKKNFDYQVGEERMPLVLKRGM